ncbi:MAG: cell division protein FtsQ [Bergeyella zoohelcum]|nr:cell division protein FtsQ [Bergeyella zoohelcum]
MKKKWRILKILITLVALGFLLNFSLGRFNNAPMDSISVNMLYPEGEEKVYFISEKDIADIVKKSNPTHKIGDISISDMEQKIDHLPAVDSANVYLNLNGDLKLDIQQKIPAFRLKKGEKDFYVDKKGEEFPTYKSYSHQTMLVTGNVKKEEYAEVISLIDKIKKDDFSRKYFIGISKTGNNYFLVTSQGDFNVELGDLNQIELKLKGFKAFVEKHLVYQEPNKYEKISLKFNNQIVATLNPNLINKKIRTN